MKPSTCPSLPKSTRSDRPHAPPCLRRQGVVVPKAQLLNSHSVVLVDNGHCPHGQQALKGGPRVQILAPIGQIVQGEQHLSARLQAWNRRDWRDLQELLAYDDWRHSSVSLQLTKAEADSQPAK